MENHSPLRPMRYFVLFLFLVSGCSRCSFGDHDFETTLGIPIHNDANAPPNLVTAYIDAAQVRLEQTVPETPRNCVVVKPWPTMGGKTGHAYKYTIIDESYWYEIEVMWNDWSGAPSYAHERIHQIGGKHPDPCGGCPWNDPAHEELDAASTEAGLAALTELVGP